MPVLFLWYTLQERASVIGWNSGIHKLGCHCRLNIIGSIWQMLHPIIHFTQAFSCNVYPRRNTGNVSPSLILRFLYNLLLKETINIFTCKNIRYKFCPKYVNQLLLHVGSMPLCLCSLHGLLDIKERPQKVMTTIKSLVELWKKNEWKKKKLIFSCEISWLSHDRVFFVSQALSKRS